MSTNNSQLGKKISNVLNSARANIAGRTATLNAWRRQTAVDTSVGSGILYFILGIIIIALVILIVMIIYYMSMECEEKKSLQDYILDTNNPLSPCVIREPDIIRNEKNEVIGQTNMSRGGIDIPFLDEVFHVSNQDYTYEQAKCKCDAYGARLATKAEITRAYNEGANWCSYGWSEGQNAYYPIQQQYLESLPNGGQDGSCGKPGVNGGFFSNPILKFGVNCYGIKPKGELIVPKKPDETPFCAKRNNFQASHQLDTDQIAPFNWQKW